MSIFQRKKYKKAQDSTRSLSSNELSVFCYQMALVLKSGMSLMEGMQLLSDEMMDSRLKAAALQMYQDIRMGLSFHDALEKHPIFPPYMINMAKIGEVSGSLDDVMEHLSSYYEKSDKLNRRIKSAVTYPLILTGLMAGVILLLVFRILPMFNDILSSIGGEMPVITMAMLNISTYLRRYLIVFALIALCLSLFFHFYLRTSKGKAALDRFLVESRLTKQVLQKISVARFCMGMSLLLKSGLGFEESLDLVQSIVGNTYIANKLKECKKAIKNGTDMMQAFMDIAIFPRLVVRMMNIGYKTGELDNTMSKVSVIYEGEVENSLQRLTSIIEPILVIILSMVVGFILLTVMLPLINIMSSIG